VWSTQGRMLHDLQRRTDVEDKIKEVEHSKLDGSHVDLKNPITVAPYPKEWSASPP
jgi:hypothetical protein